jgi:hypothetical protein
MEEKFKMYILVNNDAQIGKALSELYTLPWRGILYQPKFAKAVISLK